VISHKMKSGRRALLYALRKRQARGHRSSRLSTSNALRRDRAAWRGYLSRRAPRSHNHDI